MDTALPCGDDGDDCRDGVRGGGRACPDAIRHCRRARDGETMLRTRVVTQRCDDRNPSTTPSLVGTDSGRSGSPGVPSFSLLFCVIDFPFKCHQRSLPNYKTEINTLSKSVTNTKNETLLLILYNFIEYIQ